MANINQKIQESQKAAAGAGGATATAVKPGAGMSAGLKAIDRDFIEQATLSKARKLGVSYINVSQTPINPDLLKLLEPEAAIKAMIMPFFSVGKRLRVAVADPANAETKKIIASLKAQKYLININLASIDGLKDAFKLYESDQYKMKKKVETEYAEKDVKEYEAELVKLSELGKKLEDVTAQEGVQFVNLGALKTGASDIHYEPEENAVRVRFRIDGVLHKVFEVSHGTYKNLVNQIKYMSKMKLNINNVAQDGRYSFVANERKIDVRVSDIPTHFGESFVMRLLDSQKSLLQYEQMGFSGSYLQKMKDIETLSNGMILCTGPTGSGKTTTLYSILGNLNNEETKIITLEDPVEYNLAGVAQSQINEKRGYGFADGLRAILRQDPDVVMIGEIRDIDTAQTASQAALTGHVVLSTLHTNSAVETIPRLINMGLPPFMVAPALHTIIAQRLVRRICPDCKKMGPIPESKMKELSESVEKINKVRPNLKLVLPKELPEPQGCEKCSHTGYSGRISIAEILKIDFRIRELILKEASSNDILLSARKNGFLSLREDGMVKVVQGLTSLEEVYRVTNIAI
jgi:type II secretory ATPase GspE/PulE/Tfp pilus assembly ATPase PilB-like protein